VSSTPSDFITGNLEKSGLAAISIDCESLGLYGEATGHRSVNRSEAFQPGGCGKGNEQLNRRSLNKESNSMPGALLFLFIGISICVDHGSVSGSLFGHMRARNPDLLPDSESTRSSL
jgi:hypothetical protein